MGEEEDAEKVQDGVHSPGHHKQDQAELQLGSVPVKQAPDDPDADEVRLDYRKRQTDLKDG
eukprot:scaffold255759_cov17-Prasinocladus_malaysianus.AAC.1